MSDDNSVRKTIRFNRDSPQYQAIGAIRNQTGISFGAVAKELINHGLAPYLQASGIQLELPLETKEQSE